MNDFLLASGAIPILVDGSEDVISAIRVQSPPHLIICDLRLGAGMDGIDVVRALRAEFGAGIPAMILTGDVSPEDLRRFAESGLPVANKPVHPPLLAATMRKLLGGQSSS